MQNKMLGNVFNFFKDTVWNATHKDAAKMLISMGALAFVLGSIAQCWAIKTNEKISQKKKNFMIAQEAADGAVNTSLFLLLTRATWKISDKILKHSGLCQFSKKPTSLITLKPDGKSHLKSGCRIFTTMVASVISCNIITPLIRNVIAGKFRAYADKKDQLSDLLYLNVKKTKSNDCFKQYNDITYNALKNLSTPKLSYSTPKTSNLTI